MGGRYKKLSTSNLPEELHHRLFNTSSHKGALMFSKQIQNLLSNLTSLSRGKSPSGDFSSLLGKAMDREKKIFRSKVMVPDIYEVVLPAEEYDQLGVFVASLQEELTEMLESLATSKGYAFLHGRGEVHLVKGRARQQIAVRTEYSLENTSNSKTSVNFKKKEESSIQVTITIISSSPETNTHTVGPGEYVLGRSSNAEIRLDSTDQYISRRHCLLKIDGSSVLLEDLNSSNGTFVNGERITAETLLENGSFIGLGDSRVGVKW